MKSGSPEQIAFSPPFIRSLMFGVVLGFLVAALLTTVLEAPPLIHIIIICTAIFQLLRIRMMMFEESETSPWYVRATCSFLGFTVVSRTRPRGEIQVVEKYEESGMTSSGTAHGEKYWKEVEDSNGQNFFSKFEIFFFGHKRLSHKVETFL